MSEEQEQDKKAKPKATLIKHRKEPPAESATSEPEKKKVVIKKKATKPAAGTTSETKKPQPKIVVKRPAPQTEDKARDETRTPPDREGADTSHKAPDTSPKTPQNEEQTSQTVRLKPEGTNAPRTAPTSGDTQGRPRRDFGSRDDRGRDDRNRDYGSRPAARTGPSSRPGGRPDSDRRFSPSGDRDRRPQSGGDRRYPSGDRSRPPAGDRNRPPAGGRPSGGRPGGTGGRPGGSGGRFTPSPTGRGPGGPSGFRGRGPAPAPASSDEKRRPAKKFYKTKRRDQYPKRERQPERSIDFDRKKSRPTKLANPVPKEIDIMEVVTVSELAKKMNLKANELIAKLMDLGLMVTVNQQIDAETASIVAGEYKCKVNIVSLYDETIIETEKDGEKELGARPPIITIMGHVDHGKTQLLDAIRETDVVSGESGGITQHIGAYQVETIHGKLTFLDTPGHEAFTLMRARGSQVTDIVVLVVAADDGVMPQTREAISHAKDAGVPIIVAVNKVDLPDANADRVRQQLSDHDLVPDEWGGSTLFVEVSALKRTGIDQLLESISLQSDLLELKANHDTNAEGRVLETRIDPGRGTVSTILVQRGTLRVGDSFIAGVYPGRVRAMFDDRGNKVQEAQPSMPVEVIGLTGNPNAGDPFQVTSDEKQARQVGSKRQELRKVEEARNVKKITLDNLYDSIQEGEVQDLKVIIKGDVHGSVEALQSALERLSNSEVRLNVIHSAAGTIEKNDVMLASASNAIIVGFHVRPTPGIQGLADEEKVEIKKYSVIYDAIEDIRSAMEGMLAPELREETVGTAEVRDTFKVPKIGVIAGCYVTDGKIRRNLMVHVIREGVEIHTGKVSSLKRFKDDVREVDSGYECGIGIDNYNDLKVGDMLEAYEVKEVSRSLKGTA